MRCDKLAGQIAQKIDKKQIQNTIIVLMKGILIKNEEYIQKQGDILEIIRILSSRDD